MDIHVHRLTIQNLQSTSLFFPSSSKPVRQSKSCDPSVAHYMQQPRPTSFERWDGKNSCVISYRNARVVTRLSEPKNISRNHLTLCQRYGNFLARAIGFSCNMLTILVQELGHQLLEIMNYVSLESVGNCHFIGNQTKAFSP